MVCHTRALRDSRRVKRQNSSTTLTTGVGEEDYEDGSASPTKEKPPPRTRSNSWTATRSSGQMTQMPPATSMGSTTTIPWSTIPPEVAARRGVVASGSPPSCARRTRRFGRENEQLRKRLEIGGSTSVPVSMMPEPRPVETMMHDGERRVNSPTVGAVSVFFPEEEPEPEPDREPFNCFNASHTMYIGDAWSAEIVQAYRERVALRGGLDPGPLTEQADKRKIFWRNVFGLRDWRPFPCSCFGPSLGTSRTRRRMALTGITAYSQCSTSSSPCGRTKGIATSSRTVACSWRKAKADAKRPASRRRPARCE